jgi:hypothetical protein
MTYQRQVTITVNDKQVLVVVDREISFEEIREMEGVPNRASYSIYINKKWRGRFLPGDTMSAATNGAVDLRTESLGDEGKWNAS